MNLTERIKSVRATFGGDVAQVKGIEKLSKFDLAALHSTAAALGMDVDWLAAVISFETGGTFSPSVLNAAGSGAFGLIQFLPSTAAAILGYPNTADGKAQAVLRGREMSFAQQLREMVIPYFRGGRYNSLDDVYLKVFYPAAMNKSSDYVVGAAGTKVYEQNKGFDKNADGEITRSEITSRINAQLNSARQLPRVIISGGSSWGGLITGLAMAAAGAYYVSKKTNLLPVGPRANRKFGL